ncbi:RUS family member 1 isoform X2 [Anabrus simplex]|uniref:RUS family member 1 isoform X2 n=1 Tax=Anabrus simplex TaxID=316456 RepID=UPI0035A30098
MLMPCQMAFCSTVSGILTTEAVMKGVGVGDELASPLAATVTWILKDGVGMIAKITFAWWKGTFLDFDFKKWRFFADVINDCALSLELLLFYYSDYATLVLCFSSTLKAIVGVAGGATRAAITQHQAVRGNMADVSAKDGSQETCVNLIASMLGLLLLTYVDTSRYLVPLFLVLTTIHIFANYQAVRSVVMRTVNAARYRELLHTYLNMDRVTDPCFINKQEPILLGRGLSDVALCNHHIRMGTTIQDVVRTGRFHGYELKAVLELYQAKKYIVIEDHETNIIYVIIHKKADSSDVLQSYFHAVMMGMMATIFAKCNKEPPPSRIMERLQHEAVGNVISKRAYELRNRQQVMHLQTVVNNVVEAEFPKFKKMAESKGWIMTNHNLALDEWRGEW